MYTYKGMSEQHMSFLYIVNETACGPAQRLTLRPAQHSDRCDPRHTVAASDIFQLHD